MDEQEIARVLDPEAWARTWSTLGEGIEIQTRRERAELYARRLVAAGCVVEMTAEPENACAYTFAHTRGWCGHPNCRPS